MILREKMNTKTHCWKLYLDSTKSTDAAQQFKSEEVDNSRMTLYIKKHRIPAGKITGVSFSYFPLTEQQWSECCKEAEYGILDVIDPIVTVCHFKKEMVHSVRYDEISSNNRDAQIGSVYIPKFFLETNYPVAIKVNIDWLSALDK